MSRVDVLEAFSRALTSETHNLSRDPGLLFQQLQNRLQWEGDEVRARLRSRGQGAPQRPRAVIRMRTRQRESRALTVTIAAHAGSVNDCAIANNGDYVVSVGDDGMARQWSPRTGREIRSVRVAPPGGGGYHEFQKGATCCSVSPDGTFVLCGGAQGSVTIWDPQTGVERWSVSESSYSVNACSALPDAKHVLWARVDETGRHFGFHGSPMDSLLRIRSVGGTERTIKVKGLVNASAVSPDGRLVAVATVDGMGVGSLEVRSVHTGVALWRGQHPPLATVNLDAEGNINTDGTGNEIGFPPRIDDCAFSPDGGLVVTAGEDPKLLLWSPRSGTGLGSLQAASLLDTRSPIRRAETGVFERTACAFTPDGEAVLSGSQGGALTLWDLATGAGIATLEGHGDAVTACAIAPDGSFAASAGRDGTVRIWDMEAARGG